MILILLATVVEYCKNGQNICKLFRAMAAVVVQVKKSVVVPATEVPTTPDPVIAESEPETEVEETGSGPTGVARPFIDDEDSVT